MNDATQAVWPLGRRWLLIVLLAAAVPRVAWVVVRYTGPQAATPRYPDEEAYCLAGQSLAAGEGLVDEFGFRATYMPAYPAFLAVFTRLDQPWFWARIAQALLGAWVAPATLLLGRAWAQLARAGSKRVTPGGLVPALIAAGIAALDPYLIFFSGLLLTETLFAAVLVTTWAFILGLCGAGGSVRRAVPAGVLLWLCVMLRPSAIVLAVLAPAAVVVSRRFDRGSLTSAAVLIALVLAGLAPWAVRNRLTLGEWRWLTTRGGISLYDGLRHGATGASDLAHAKTLPDVQGLTECQWDRYFRSRALADARREPMRVVALAWRKLLRTWSPTPNVEAYRRGLAATVGAAWTWAVLALAVAGLWICRRAARTWFLLLLPVIAFTLVHTIFVGSVRYRVPIMPMVMVLSGAGAARLWRRLASAVRPASKEPP